VLTEMNLRINEHSESIKENPASYTSYLAVLLVILLRTSSDLVLQNTYLYRSLVIVYFQFP
jgi:hypothetical protein